MTLNAMRKSRGRVIDAVAAKFAVGGNLEETFFEVARCGEYYDWRYGLFEVTPLMLDRIKANHDANVAGVKVALDVNHEEDHRACAWLAELKLQDVETRLPDGTVAMTRALLARFVDWTTDGEKYVSEGEYRYFSVEFEPIDRPDGNGGVETVPYVLTGIALTNRPVLVGMEGTFSQKAAADAERQGVDKSGPDDGAEQETRNNMFKDAVKKLGDAILSREKVTKSDVDGFKMMLSELPEEEREELKETEEKVEQKAEETAEAEAEEAKDLARKSKATETMEAKLSKLAKDNEMLLAEKAKRDESDFVESVTLSRAGQVGFTKDKEEELRKFHKEVGHDNALKFAKMLESAVRLSEEEAEEKGSGVEGDESGDDESGDSQEKDMSLARERAEKNGTPIHEELSRIYSERAEGKK